MDKETQHAAVYVSYKHPRLGISSVSEFTQYMLHSCFEQALNNRCVNTGAGGAGL